MFKCGLIFLLSVLTVLGNSYKITEIKGEKSISDQKIDTLLVELNRFAATLRKSIH